MSMALVFNLIYLRGRALLESLQGTCLAKTNTFAAVTGKISMYVHMDVIHMLAANEERDIESSFLSFSLSWNRDSGGKCIK